MSSIPAPGYEEDIFDIEVPDWDDYGELVTGGGETIYNGTIKYLNWPTGFDPRC